PDMPENDFIDKKIPPNKIPYYRISYTMRGGKTIFTAAQSLHDKKIASTPVIEETEKKMAPATKASYLTVSPKGYVIIHLPEPTDHYYHIIIY
ncbi:hypothetical protein ACSTHW_23305, partial [Vibrio parahaemolyticus]